MATPKCSRCRDTGMIAIRSRDGSYAFPGPVPDDAKGYADADCWYCDCAPPPPRNTEHLIRGVLELFPGADKQALDLLARLLMKERDAMTRNSNPKRTGGGAEGKESADCFDEALVGLPGADPVDTVVGDAKAEEPSPIEIISERKHRIGDVAVTFTVGRIKPREHR